LPSTHGTTLDRRTFLAGAGLSTAALLGGCASAHRARPTGLLEGRRPNFLILLTDQQRVPMHWPADKIAELQPSYARLAAHGLTFRRGFTSAAQCTPSRGAIMTGTYPWANGVTNTDGGAPLQSHQMNLGRLLAGAGYDVAYKGKWHLSTATAGNDRCSARDIANMAERYGLPGWNPPDAGVSLSSVPTAGGGTPNNDGRFVSGATAGAAGQTPGFGESILDALERMAKGGKPFGLFASLVNPHDVGFYPKFHKAAGYTAADFAGLGIGLPANFVDPLETKPGVQAAFKKLFNDIAPIDDDTTRREYVNFYAYLHGVVDPHIARILDALDALRLTEGTIVFRFSDHGEQGLSHGLIEKMYCAYEETIHVPVIVSNPRLFPRAIETDAFWSHVDLLPTIAALAGVPPDRVAALGTVGVDQGPVLANPAASVQDSVLFTFDDRFGSAQPGVVVDGVTAPAMPADQPPHIRTIRETSWKYSVYFAQDGSALQYELYNLADDPGELRNLAFAPTSGTLDAERQRLHARLTRKLRATATLPLGFAWPQRSGAARA
jgi:choline-sulfatase